MTHNTKHINMEFCPTCGIPTDHATTESLWDIYNRIRDGRSTYEPLVFDSAWTEENIIFEEDMEAVDAAMERDMYNRGLCITCGRPDLRGVKPEDIMDPEEAKEIQNMWAMEAMERRMGC